MEMEVLWRRHIITHTIHIIITLMRLAVVDTRSPSVQVTGTAPAARSKTLPLGPNA